MVNIKGKKMEEKQKSSGKIYVANRAIATIAYQSALESYGVVGMADKDIIRGISKILFNDPTSGVIVDYNGDAIKIEMYIIIEYGTRISSVADSVAHSVKFQVEKMIGITVESVNVHVRGLRVSSTD
jgi:uncharacterized alkaline shock family protein YloU